MKFNSIRQRLTLWFVVIALLPMLLIGYSMEHIYETELQHTVEQHLSTIADKKLEQIDNYLKRVTREAQIKSQGQTVAQAIQALEQTVSKHGFDSKEYRQIDETYREHFSQFLDKTEHYDLFLISTDGTVIYSQRHEADFTSNVLHGPLQDTGLGKATRNALENLDQSLSDMDLYGPSNNLPSLFIAVPIIQKRKLLGVFALQISQHNLFQTITNDTGLGYTGETLVARWQGQNSALVMAPLLSDNQAAFKKIISFDGKHPLALEKALHGERGSGYRIDYQGNEVVAAWRYLPQLRWGMVVKIDSSEALAPLFKVRNISLGILLLTSILMLVSIYFATKRFIKPINQLNQSAHAIATGKLDQRVAVTGQDELSQLAETFNLMAERIQLFYGELERQVTQRTLELSKSLIDLHIKDAAFASSINAMAIIDLNDKLTFANHSFLKMWHLNTMEQAVGQNINYFLGVSSKHKHIQTALEQQGHWFGDISVHLQDGTPLELQLSASMVRNKQGTAECILVSFVDITPQKQAERDLIEAKKVAETASRTKSQFLANMSHEIRTPMNAILGLTQLVLESGLPPHQEDFLKKVHVSARALLGILNDILDFSKIEANQMSIEQIPFKLETTLVDVANLFSAAAQEKNLELFFEIAPDIPSHIISDPLRLSQVLTNLISNAMKFTEKGDIHVKAEIITKQADNLQIRFSVRDTGIGINKAQIERLFQAFSQADSSTTRKYGGTGLGLSISQRLVQLMGGNITASANEDRGSTFSFTIRCKQAPNIQRLNIQQLQGLHILIVDDHETSRQILQKLLQNWGTIVHTAASGSEALAKIQTAKQEPYDIILLDWLMPLMDGIQVARQIEYLSAQGLLSNPLKVFMVTAHDKEKLLSKMGSMKVSGVLVKPIIPSQLYNQLLECRFPHATAVLKQQKIRKHHELNGINILLVEDNQINRLMAGELLQKRGALVRFACNGMEAVEAVRQQDKIDVILMDLHMPVMDGIEATKIIRQMTQGKEIPIIAMTAAVMQEDVDLCHTAGMVSFIAKPIEPDIVVSTLLKYVTPIASNTPEPAQKETETRDISLEGFDINRALHRLDGNWSLLSKLLLSFAQEHHHFLEKVDSLLANHDISAAILQLHTLKGVAANLGAAALSQAARDWEQALKTHSDNNSRENFAQALQHCFDTIRQHVQTPVLFHNSQLNDTSLIELLQRIQPYLQQQELLPDALLQALQPFADHTEIAILIAKIDDFDHAGALVTINDLLKPKT